MLAYRIHSRKDGEGWLLKALKYLTDERLRLKKLAKQGDKEAEHAQNALKVLINSVYGFYGSGFKFNDFNAAAEVTRRGREILALIVYTIEEHGGIVAEFDTDGVIFSHPDPTAVVEAINRRNTLLPCITIPLPPLCVAVSLLASLLNWERRLKYSCCVPTNPTSRAPNRKVTASLTFIVFSLPALVGNCAT